jgi:GTP-binding protein
MDFKYKTKYKAETGEAGQKRNRYGKKAPDLVIRVPVGTVILDSESGMLMCDLTVDGSQFIAAIGGKGGLGNANFRSSVRQAPNFAEAGGQGTERLVRLELKLIADVGLVGFPNVGKSTLLSVSSKAKPKIADYHFTTLYPNLGIVTLANTEFAIADIPGLIEGAAAGAGLGHDFLKHVERTKMLIHVIDAAGTEGRNPLDDFKRIEEELAAYSDRLPKKPQIAALNKMDVADPESDAYKELTAYLDELEIPYYPISAATTKGVSELLNATAAKLDLIAREALEDEDQSLYESVIEVVPADEEPDYRDIKIRKVYNDDGDEIFDVSGKQLKKIFDSTNFNDYGSLRYLYHHLVRTGTIEKMKKQGLEEGDTVRIYDLEFEYTDEE